MESFNYVFELLIPMKCKVIVETFGKAVNAIILKYDNKK